MEESSLPFKNINHFLRRNFCISEQYFFFTHPQTHSRMCLVVLRLINVPGPCSSWMTQFFSPPGLSFLLSCLLNMEILSFTGLGSLPAILPGPKLLDWSLRLLPLWSRNIISWQDLLQHVFTPLPSFLIFSSWSMLFLCTSMLQCPGSFSYLSMTISSLRLGSISSSFSSWSLSSGLCISAFCDL